MSILLWNLFVWAGWAAMLAKASMLHIVFGLHVSVSTAAGLQRARPYEYRAHVIGHLSVRAILLLKSQLQS